MDFLKIVKERGFLHQCTDEAGLAKVMEQPIKAYIGFDCTAKSLHVGSLLQIMILRWLQKCGHTPIVLFGGGTTQVGDPSGKDEMRQLLTKEAIEANKNGIKQVFATFLDSKKTIYVDNADWLEGLNYIAFLRDYGRHFSVNRMLTQDSVRLRLERDHHLSFLEFNYMVLQAYDFVELHKRHACRLQIGGSDQWGNIISGTDLNHKVGGKDVFGLTTPLITTSSGAKMGKTAAGAVWLNGDMTSPYDYWQFWRNTEDGDVIRFLKLFTELPLEEIAKLETLQGSDINQAKIVLANEATKLLHGESQAKQAEETAKKTFEQGAAGEGLPTVTLPKAELDAGIPAFKLFHQAGLASSGGEARKLIQGGGGKVNDEPIDSETLLITSAHLKDGKIKLSAGKKKHLLIRAQ